MGKRPAEALLDEADPLKGGERPFKAENGNEEGEFEDEFEDEFESEDEIIEAGVDGQPDEERDTEGSRDAMDVDQRTFIPGRDTLATGESLTPDTSAYEMLHTLGAPWPCLSFDILRDVLGENRRTYPATLYAVAGTQAARKSAKENQLMVMKLSGLGRMDKEQDDDDSSDEDDEETADPILETKSIPLTSTTNRIRAHQVPSPNNVNPQMTFTALMSEDNKVIIHDITPHFTSFDTPGCTVTPQQNKPMATLTIHETEGYAIDWSPLVPEGKLLTGDNNGKIFMSSCGEAGKWTVDAKPFNGHQGSVEDLQWSPSESKVFASASSDGTVKIWDARAKSHRPAISVTVSETDVNVISWSRQTMHLLATGADDGQWAVWDLRKWRPNSNIPSAAPTPVASFHFNKEQITSIEWHPTDDSIVAVAAGDNTLTLWDLAVELDDEESNETAGVADIPPQLLFVHYFKMVKECHWHQQIPGCVMATGDGGFGVFKTISV